MEKYKIIYKIDKKNKNLRLLGHEFYQRNKNRGYYILNNQKQSLVEKLEIKNNIKNEIKIHFIFYKKIYNKSLMFKDCISLLKISEVNNVDKKYYIPKIIYPKEEDDNYLDFYDDNHSSDNSFEKILMDENYFLYYSTIPINSQNASKISKISGICEFLKMIPDNKSNKNLIMTLEEIFNNCTSLKSLPDISKWDTSSVIDMSGIFNNCTSLKSLPDISKWNTRNVKEMSMIFGNCLSLISLPDIRKWNINNVVDISALFANCSSLVSLPDISNWSTNNVNDMKLLFMNCSSLISLPNI